MSTSTHMETYPCICSSSQQHSSLQMSHLPKLASCSLNPVAEEWELQDNLIQTVTQLAKYIYQFISDYQACRLVVRIDSYYNFLDPRKQAIILGPVTI